MKNSILALVAAFAMVSSAVQVQAGHGCATGCYAECPSCNYRCDLKVEKEDVEKYCWEVECKPICIPRVTFPWECGCPPKCAKVKKVNVLKKHTYECPQCKYTWTPVETCCGNGCCAQGGCCDANGGDLGCGAVAPVEIMPEEAQPPVPAAPEPASARAQDRDDIDLPLTGQRPTWFDSAQRSVRKVGSVLPVRLLKAADGQPSR